MISDSRQEVRPSDQKMVNKTYYYIDYKTFVDVVKYKMYMMKKSIEDQLQTVQNLPFYQTLILLQGNGEQRL